MKSTITVLCFTALLVFVMSSSFSSAELDSPCDAPLIQGGLTAAPGEGSCGQTGCHAGNVNSGNAIVSLDINDGQNDYVPGQTYPVTVKIAQPGINKFGFQITVLKDSGNSFTGAFSLTDAVNTRLINALGRKYVGTTACGSDANPQDSLQWDFEWTAPPADEGSLSIYLITIATNHNHSGSGDFVYTQTLQLNPLLNAVNEISVLEKSIRVFPNPADEMFVVEYEMESRGEVDISLFAMDGKLIFQSESTFQLPGVHQQTFERQQLGLQPGVYVVKIKTDDGQAIRKITFL
jgi:Secretion system C-terminal sorting domain/Reeler domain